MPLQLTTPLSVGAIDANSPYQIVKILQLNIYPGAKVIELTLQHGNVVDGVFVPGMAVEGVTVKRLTVSSPDYETLVAAKSAGADEVYYDKVSNLLYQWLLDNSHFVGTIV